MKNRPDHKQKTLVNEHLDLDYLAQGETPRRIIDSALKEISVRGLSGTTTKAISKRARLSTGIIHHYFDTKDNLVYAVYAFLVKDLHTSTLAIFKKEPDPKKRLVALIHMNFSNLHLSREGRDVWPQFWANGSHDERVERLIKVYYRRYHSNLAYCFNALFDDKVLARQVATLLLSTIHGVWFTHRFADLPANNSSAIQWVEQHLELLLNQYQPNSV